MRCLTASFLPKPLARETSLALQVGAASSVIGEAGGAAEAFEVDESAVNLIVKFSSFCGQGRSDSLRD
jgi:phage shock protein PspC (stress-responsive transcriptional regulator)